MRDLALYMFDVSFVNVGRCCSHSLATASEVHYCLAICSLKLFNLLC